LDAARADALFVLTKAQHRASVAFEFERECAGVRLAASELGWFGEDSAGGSLLERRMQGVQGCDGVVARTSTLRRRRFSGLFFLAAKLTRPKDKVALIQLAATLDERRRARSEG
jgi:hypothetical protein